jgi:hypothetical protein
MIYRDMEVIDRDGGDVDMIYMETEIHKDTEMIYQDRNMELIYRDREEIEIANVWRAGYIPGDRLTSWVYSTTCVQYLYIHMLLFIRQ